MRAHIPGRYAAIALLLGGLACAGNKAGSDDGTVVAQDTTMAKDTAAYKGSMERDTTAMPADTSYAPAPAPTAPADTSSMAPTAPADTTSYQPAPAPTAPTDTSSYAPAAPTDSVHGPVVRAAHPALAVEHRDGKNHSALFDSPERAEWLSIHAVRLLEQPLRDRLQLHVARPLVNRPDLRIAVVFLRRVLLRIPVTSEELEAGRGDAVGHL